MKAPLLFSKVKWWDDGKGYGFLLNPTPGGDDIFVHHNGIIGRGHKSLHAGDDVQFNVEDVPGKGLRAYNVLTRCPEVAGGPSSARPNNGLRGTQPSEN